MLMFMVMIIMVVDVVMNVYVGRCHVVDNLKFC